jgi:hypothetical protein
LTIYSKKIIIEFMKNLKHEKFIYHNYSIDSNGFEYHFSMGEYEFRPRWTAHIPIIDDTLHELVFSLGMVELVSYWKSACPPIVEVECGRGLDEWQIQWWKKLYRNGLGEFFYVNNITPTESFMTITSTASTEHAPMLSEEGAAAVASRELTGSLIPVGGGKDSIVTLELLRDSMKDNLCYIVGDIKRACDSAVMAGYRNDQIIKVKRTIDPTLIELNKKGALNGHTPFSAIIAFSSLIFAYLSKKKYIVLSNESSANEGNVGNLEVNHQYSKSTEFESDFREYVERLSDTTAAPLPEYFSLLRPWNELQITRRFTQYPQYFTIFQSCNVGTRTNTWCCKCAKCLYVYIMLAAFIDESELSKIFGDNLLNNPELPELDGILHALKNPELDKPFECVGTREEVNLALDMISGNASDTEMSNLFNSFDSVNFVPASFICKLK